MRSLLLNSYVCGFVVLCITNVRKLSKCPSISWNYCVYEFAFSFIFYVALLISYNRHIRVGDYSWRIFVTRIIVQFDHGLFSVQQFYRTLINKKLKTDYLYCEVQACSSCLSRGWLRLQVRCKVQ